VAIAMLREHCGDVLREMVGIPPSCWGWRWSPAHKLLFN